MKKKLLTTEDKMRIISLVEDTDLSQAEVARMYGVHRSRIHHIINDTYGCRSRLPLPEATVSEDPQ